MFIFIVSGVCLTFWVVIARMNLMFVSVVVVVVTNLVYNIIYRILIQELSCSDITSLLSHLKNLVYSEWVWAHLELCHKMNINCLFQHIYDANLRILLVFLFQTLIDRWWHWLYCKQLTTMLFCVWTTLLNLVLWCISFNIYLINTSWKKIPCHRYKFKWLRICQGIYSWCIY